MTFGVRRTSRFDAWIAPGVGLCFSVIVAVLAPHYASWYGTAMPALSRWFLAFYPLWIVLMVLALLVQAFMKTLRPSDSSNKLFDRLNNFLSFVSVLIIIVGIIALALPTLANPPI